MILPLLLIFAARANAQAFGAVIYVGDNSADVLMFDLDNTNFTKVEFYRGAKLIGTVNLNAGDGKIVTDYNLVKGNTYQYQFRAYRSAGGFMDGNLINGFFIGGDLQGILVRPDTINMTTDMVDSVFVWPGGNFHFGPQANVHWILGVAGTLSGIQVLASDNPTQAPHGQFSASGGTLNDISIQVWGKLGPLKDFTFMGSDVPINSDEESLMDNVKFEWVTDQGRNDYAWIRHYSNNIVARRCTLTHEAQLVGVKDAENCLIERDATMIVSNVRGTTVNEGQITLSPSGIATTMRNCNIIDGNVTLSNKSVVEFNTLSRKASLNISPTSGGFDPKDIKDVHVNYNHFTREGGQVGNIANFQADTIDGTLNYWGQCQGPSLGERSTMGKVRLDPFLRVQYPGASYWMDLSASKTKIIANDEDSIEFVGHFYNVLTGLDSAGVEFNYLITVAGDTLYKGTVLSDDQGIVRLVIKMPAKYSSVTGFSVFFTSPLQCIEKSYFMTIEKQSGPDLEVYAVELTQPLGPTTNLIANKAFALQATVVSSEAINTPFKVVAEVNGNKYDRFYVLDKANIGVDYTFENQRQDLTIPRGQPLILVFLVNELGLNPGTAEISVTVDPAEPGNPKGRIVEANEFNNSKVVYATVKGSAFGNDGSANLNVYVQPFDGYLQTQYFRVPSWADSAKSFMQQTWPLKNGQVNMETAPTVADYSFINPDTLQQDTYQYYLMKSYKQLIRQNPAADRYVLAVQPHWFTFRLDRKNFNHRASQTLSWSGVWDLMVASTDHNKHLVHTLGHSFNLRRQDLDPDNIDQKEQYIENFIAADVFGGIDVASGRIMSANFDNKVSRRMKAKCFMGGSQTPSPNYDYYLWVSEFEYNKLFTAYDQFTRSKSTLSKGVVPKALFIEGNVTKTNGAFDFGPWMRLESATPSSMVEAQYATHTFKVLDAGNQEIATYRYAPTFRALGLDEVDALTSDDPRMDVEHFAFVIPYTDDARKVVVEKEGNVVAERVLSATKPVVSFEYPVNGQPVKSEKFQARWTATDADGDSRFWYTTWLSTDGGVTWTYVTYENEATQDSIAGLFGRSYILRVVANDGVNTSDTVQVQYSVLNNTNGLPTPNVFGLQQNYPNPFNPSTTISFTLPTAGHTILEVYDALGRVVATPVDGHRGAGTHTLNFSADGLPSGVYNAVLRSGSRSSSIQMTLTR